MKKHELIFVFCLLTHFCFGQAEIKTMFYNLLNFSSAPPQDRLEHLNFILNSYQPDLFMISEVESQSDTQDILDECFNYTSSIIEQSPFLFNTSGPSYIHQHVFYDKDKFTLNFTSQIKTNIRSINHYNFKLNTEKDIQLDVFVAHFKASQGEINANERRYEAEQLVQYLSTFDQNANIILAGDFNMYSSDEEGYNVLLNATEAFNFIDPINTSGNWHNNSEFASVHTQSTRTSNNEFDDYGAGGGLDDRFDMMLISDAIHSSNQSISYIEGSYQAWGNNSNCFNNNINSVDCDGEFSIELREALYQMSDHLPVVMQLRVEDEFLHTHKPEKTTYFKLSQGNVTSQELHVMFSSDLIGNRVGIFNQIGQEVVHFKVLDLQMSIDLTVLAPGLYVIKVENLSKTEKFFKLN